MNLFFFGTNFKNAIAVETGPCIDNHSRIATSTSLYCGCTKIESIQQRARMSHLKTMTFRWNKPQMGYI